MLMQPDMVQQLAEIRQQIVSSSAVVFLAIFLMIFLLFDEKFRERAKPALILFRVSQIILSVLVIMPEKEAGGLQSIRRKGSSPVPRTQGAQASRRQAGSRP